MGGIEGIGGNPFGNLPVNAGRSKKAAKTNDDIQELIYQADIANDDLTADDPAYPDSRLGTDFQLDTFSLAGAPPANLSPFASAADNDKVLGLLRGKTGSLSPTGQKTLSNLSAALSQQYNR
jgi:hypothetical protein